MNAPADPQFAARIRRSRKASCTAASSINKAGRTLTVARAEVYAVGGTLPGRTDHPE